MIRNPLFYFLSFLEGASVMAAELLGAKMLAPYFGTSLYVWSSVLAVTLGGLASGYFTGGILSVKKNTEQRLYYILLASAILLIIMPITAKEVMIHSSRFSLLTAIIISTLLFLSPPIFFMGMVSPMIVKCVSSESDKAGKAAGTVYAISTVGGIVSTFLLGFYFIPNFGLTKPAIVSGVILGIIPFIKLILSKRFFSLIFPLAAFFSFNNSKTISENSSVKILYSSEGLLGQIIVADYPMNCIVKKNNSDSTSFQRVLFVNRSTQTIVTTNNGKKVFFDYVNIIAKRISDTSFNHNSSITKKALVLGLGGGSVANELVNNNFGVDAVELDARINEVAKKYFDLDNKVNVTIDDARHCVRQSLSHRLYDMIILDTFIGEINPHHLFTKEFFSEIKSVLSDSGIFFINGNGYWNGETGKGMRSVCKTLLNSSFDVEIIPTGEDEDFRNLVFIATPTNAKKGNLTSKNNLSLNLDDAVILTDEKPQLEILNAEANKRWREASIKYFLSGYYSKQDNLLFK